MKKAGSPLPLPAGLLGLSLYPLLRRGYRESRSLCPVVSGCLPKAPRKPKFCRSAPFWPSKSPQEVPASRSQKAPLWPPGSPKSLPDLRKHPLGDVSEGVSRGKGFQGAVEVPAETILNASSQTSSGQAYRSPEASSSIRDSSNPSCSAILFAARQRASEALASPLNSRSADQLRNVYRP